MTQVEEMGMTIVIRNDQVQRFQREIDRLQQREVEAKRVRGNIIIAMYLIM